MSVFDQIKLIGASFRYSHNQSRCMNFSTPEKRKKLKQYYRLSDAAFAEWAERGYVHPPPNSPEYPEECLGMACSARTRKGTKCKQISVYANGRCKFHGGMSTGPKSKAGKRRSALNGFRPKQAKPM